MPRLVPAVVAAVLVVLVASACTPDQPGPNYSSVTPTPSSSTAPTPTSSPSPSGFPTSGPNVSPGEVAPTEPASVDANTSDGAISFIAYYLKATDWLFATSDTTLVNGFYGDDCATCRSAQQYLAGLLAGGSHFKGGRIAIKQIQVVKNDGRQSADFAITSVSDVGAAQVVSPAGKVVRTFSASEGFQLTDWVRFVDGSWKIVEERKV